jgi:hypothetical protein
MLHNSTLPDLAEVTNARQIAHPTYRLGFTESNFFLFDYRKQKSRIQLQNCYC